MSAAQSNLAFSVRPSALPKPSAVPTPAAQPRGDLCFIETQFPVSKMSKESYAERRANQSQTITGLGKWWGRKPLVLCRATIVSLLLPATDNPEKDREVFLRLMTMDDDGLLRRKSVNIGPTELFNCLPPADRARCFEPGSHQTKAKLKRGLAPERKSRTPDESIPQPILRRTTRILRPPGADRWAFTRIVGRNQRAS